MIKCIEFNKILDFESFIKESTNKKNVRGIENDEYFLSLIDKIKECNNCGFTFDNLKRVISVYSISAKKVVQWSIENNLPKLDLFLLNYGIDRLLISKELNLSDAGLLEIPERLFLLSNIEKLDLSNNPFNSLNNNIKTLFNLRTLNLSNCVLKEIPESFCDLYSLETLILNDNLISYLPKNIHNLKNLKEIQIQNNPNFKVIELEKLNKKIKVVK